MAEFGESSYRRFLQGDKAALEALIITYSDPLVRYAYSLVSDASVAEDVVAESFAALFLKARNIGSSEHLRRYLYRIARSKAMDYLRRHRAAVPLEDIQNVLGTGDPEQEVQLRQRDKTVYVCMQRLPRDYRDVLMLTYFDRLTAEEVCAVLGKSKKQVYNLHARAKIALRELLEKEGITHEDLS